jgi:large subunit ribosomal protein L28
MEPRIEDPELARRRPARIDFIGSPELTESGRSHSMAKMCEVCGKSTTAGRQVSHAHNVTPRTFEPNLRSVKALVDGAVRTVRVCARCLRSGKIQRPPSRKRILAELASDS